MPEGLPVPSGLQQARHGSSLALLNKVGGLLHDQRGQAGIEFAEVRRLLPRGLVDERSTSPFGGCQKDIQQDVLDGSKGDACAFANHEAGPSTHFIVEAAAKLFEVLCPEEVSEAKGQAGAGNAPIV